MDSLSVDSVLVLGQSWQEEILYIMVSLGLLGKAFDRQ